MRTHSSVRQFVGRIGITGLALAMLAGSDARADAAAGSRASQGVITCVQSVVRPADSWSSPFTQTQHLSVLSTPLLSTGEIELEQGTIRWTVLTPIRQTLTIDAKGRMHGDDGTTMDHPAVANLVKMLLTLDTTGLESAFTTTGSCTADTWQLTLLPKNPAIAALFERIDVRGGRSLGAVILHARGGDSTTITFAAGDAGNEPVEARDVHAG